MNEQHESVSIDHDPVGARRVVRWTVDFADGSSRTLGHDYPDALQHHYGPRGTNEDVPLYQGPFSYDDGPSLDGDVRYRWFPTPRIEARGTRTTSTSDAMRQLFGSPEDGLWVDVASVGVPLDGGSLPRQPVTLPADVPNVGYGITEQVEQEVGAEADLERVTFLVPNAFESHDAKGIADPADLRRYWFGRTTSTGAGWDVVLDQCQDMRLKEWQSLRDVGGFRFTHIGSLVRADGAPFTGTEAFEALARVRVALNIALGRRTTCCLPVGWRSDLPVWTRFRSAPVDPHTTRTHWLDRTVASQQVSEVIARVLDFSADPARWAALKAATAYYVAANVDVDVELSVSVPVSALQMLSYFRFVADRNIYSNTKWHDLTTEDQLRLLLDDAGVDLSIQPHFEHLVDVRDRLATSSGHQRDGLGVLMKMRNVVTHPTRDRPDTFDVYEWAEAGMHARYWLCLALLNTIGYTGSLARTLEATPQWPGQLRAVPWAVAAP